jgi:hypothetical protein
MVVKNMNNILLVGGNFDENGGKQSSLVNAMYSAIVNACNASVKLINGGDLEEATINAFSKAISRQFDIVLWFPNISNDVEKVRNIKEINEEVFLVTSKRNIGNQYSFAELINHALKLKSNLLVEITSGKSGRYNGRVIDPLGNIICDYTEDFNELIVKVIHRLAYLQSITREHTTCIGNAIEVPDEVEFFKIIRNFATTFHNLIHPAKDVSRFLGNAAFRCERGFPSFRSGKNNDIIFVSRRDVDKRYISKDAFVGVKCLGVSKTLATTRIIGNLIAGNSNVGYYGNFKPSVDTPIQLRLFIALRNVNYMIHSHVYVEGANFTSINIPCGGIEEFDEIMNAINWDGEETDFAVNLIGHGSIVFASDVDYFYEINYYARPIPEIIS